MSLLPRLAVATAVVMVAMGLVDRPLRTGTTPHGIVSLELAGDVQTARSMVDAWSPRARIAAGVSLGLDYLFLALYSTTLALACRRVAARAASAGAAALAALGDTLAWGQWAAGGADGVENIALIRMLLDGVADPWPAIAWWFAALKFGLLGLGIAYILGGWAATRPVDARSNAGAGSRP